jgi:hypothetical protein
MVPADTASAQDPLAPAGAAADWLPSEPWVMRHWLPYRERDLAQLLGVRDRSSFPIGDTRPLAAALRARRVTVTQAVARLLKPWRSRVSSAHYRLLASRTRRTLTQPHLAVHLFSHPFHIDELNRRWPTLFGVDVATTYDEMWRHGLSYIGVARRHRGPGVPLIGELSRLFDTVADEGVRRREVLPAQARALAARQRSGIGGWLQYRPNPTARAAVRFSHASASRWQTARRCSAGCCCASAVTPTRAGSASAASTSVATSTWAVASTSAT